MGRNAEIPLSDILLIPEISPRDTALTGTQAASAVTARARRKQLEAMILGIKLWDDSKGKVGSVTAFGGLIVAEPPADLPVSYPRRLKAGQLVLVDGYQRYKALVETKGLDYRVSIKRVEAPTMRDLRQKAFECNFQPNYFLPLTQEEVWAHFLRESLSGSYTGMTQSEILKQYGGWIKLDYLKDLNTKTSKIRDLCNLAGLSEQGTKKALKEFVLNCNGTSSEYDFDSTGFPFKAPLVKALEIAEYGWDAANESAELKAEKRSGQFDQWIEKQKKAKLEVLEVLKQQGMDRADILRELAEMLDNKHSVTTRYSAGLSDHPEGFDDNE